MYRGDDDPVDLPSDEQTSDEESDNDVPPESVEEDEEEDYEDVEAFPDEYFDEESIDDSDIDESTESVEGGNGTSPRRPPFFHCVVGGYGPQGPLPTISHVVPSLPRRPRLIPSLPQSFPLGMQGIYTSVVGGNQLFACSPGSTSVTSGFFTPFGTSSVQPGGCYAYTNSLSGWQPFGSPMNTYRGGSSMTRMGRFFIATGGRRFPSALDSIEVLNTRNPRRWRTLSKLTLPAPTFDHCTVALNKTALLVTGGFGQESQAVVVDLKSKKWEAMAPMKQPRRKVYT